MKIAIHQTKGSFSDKWIQYCIENNIPYKVVNCYSSEIVSQLEDCDGLMWHWSHLDFKAAQFARQLTYSLELAGKVVFPSSKGSWHFDDKVGQKYLLEAIKAPILNTFISYDKNESLSWAKNATFPKIFKLKGGAGSINVKMVSNQNEAIDLINIAFGKGFKLLDTKNTFKERTNLFKKRRDLFSFINFLKGYIRMLFPDKNAKIWGRSKGYVYFQDFVENLDHDIRVIVIGDKAFAIKRFIRSNDFRASGSGHIIYDINDISIEYIKTSFFWAKKIGSECIAFDFIKNNGTINILEISYGFFSNAYTKCPGFWDVDLNWHTELVIPENFIIKNFLQQIDKSNV